MVFLRVCRKIAPSIIYPPFWIFLYKMWIFYTIKIWACLSYCVHLDDLFPISHRAADFLYPFFSPSLVFTPSPVVTTIVFSFCAFLLFVCFPCFLFILLLPCPSYCIFLECILYFYFLNFLSLGNLNLPFFSPLNNFYWTLVDLQCCVSFYYAAKWIIYTHVHSF